MQLKRQHWGEEPWRSKRRSQDFIDSVINVHYAQTCAGWPLHECSHSNKLEDLFLYHIHLWVFQEVGVESSQEAILL